MDTQLEQEPALVLPMSVRLIQEAKERHVKELALLRRVAWIIDKVPASVAEKCALYCGRLDFNNLSREESVAAMVSLGAGRWRKEVNGYDPSMIDYSTEIDGIGVRLWAAAPPDTCRVIEVEEEVPATKIVRRKLVCSDANP